MRKAIGFYWTLPVPWAGFREVDTRDVDKAASHSKTIAMQRSAVRAYAKAEGYDLIHEVAHIEIAPDRGGEEIDGDLAKLAERARELEAQILFVDFGTAIQQRHHHYLKYYAAEHDDLFLPVDPHEQFHDAFRAHFAGWRAKQAEWTSGKAARIAAASARTKELQAEGHKLPKIAAMLEAEGLRSATGSPWTTDSLRKMLRQAG